MISFLLPTRKRFNYAKKSIESIIETANNKNSFEINLVIDNDDQESIDAFNSWNKDFNYTLEIIPRVGYHFLHEYYNRAASSSKGKWLWVWNDDCTMISKNWDNVILEGYNSKDVKIINPLNLSNEYYVRVGRCMFPIIPKFFYDTTGVISRNQHVDNYIEEMEKALGNIMHLEERLQHLHPEERIRDEVTNEKRYNSNQNYCSTEVFNTDIGKIKDYCIKNNLKLITR